MTLNDVLLKVERGDAVSEKDLDTLIKHKGDLPTAKVKAVLMCCGTNALAKKGVQLLNAKCLLADDLEGIVSAWKKGEIIDRIGKVAEHTLSMRSKQLQADAEQMRQCHGRSSSPATIAA